MSSGTRKISKKSSKNGAFANERFKITIDTLRTGIADESIFTPGHTVSLALDKTRVKSALDYLLESNDAQKPLAHVILDNSKHGSLFSQKFNEEASASIECLQKIQSIVKNEGLKVPLFVVTETNNQVKIVVINPVLDQMELHFIDPFTGSRDVLRQTTTHLFDQYLRVGSQKHSLAPLRGLRQHSDLKACSGCKVDSATGWWALFYCLMFLQQRNDGFLFDKAIGWANELHVRRLKTLITTQLDFLFDHQADPINVEIKDGTQETVNSLVQMRILDQQIRKEVDSRCQEIEEEVQRQKNMSANESIKRERDLEKSKTAERQRVKQEIQELEELVRTNEELISTLREKEPAVVTTDQKYKQFISGEKRRRIEAQVKKKEEKARDLILSQNQKANEEFINEQVKMIEEMIASDQKTVSNLAGTNQTKINKRSKFSDEIRVDRESIARIQSSVQDNSKTKANLENVLNEFKERIDGINNIRIDAEPHQLIKLLVNNDSSLDIQSLNNDILKSDKEIDKLEQEKASETKERESEISLNKAIETKIDLLNGKLTGSKQACGNLASEIDKLKNSINEYNPWYFYYNPFCSEGWNKLNADKSQKEAELEKEKKNQKELGDDLKTKNSNLETSAKKIAQSQAKEEDLKHRLECKQSERANLLNKLRTIRDKVLDQLSDKIKESKDKVKRIEIQDAGDKMQLSNLNKRIVMNQDTSDRLEKEIRDTNSLITNYEMKINERRNEIVKLTERLKLSFETLAPVTIQEPDDCDESIVAQDDEARVFNSSIITDKLYDHLAYLCCFEDQKWRLLYRASRDGFGATQFHRSCGSHRNTLVLIKSANGNKFGGFTGAHWSCANETESGFVDDPHAFIFSFRNSQGSSFVAKVSDSTRAIYRQPDLGPCFGNDDITISDSKCSSDFGYSYEHPDFEYKTPKAQKILAGSHVFKIAELEVFCKIYEPLSQESMDKYKRVIDRPLESIYETFNTIAINCQISESAFVGYLEKLINIFKNQEELSEMRNLFTYMFKYFDSDNSGKLDFGEFLECVRIFDSKKKGNILKAVFGFFFDLADKNNDGVLDIEEVIELISKFPHNKGLMHLQERFDKKTFTKERGAEIFCEYYSLETSLDD